MKVSFVRHFSRRAVTYETVRISRKHGNRLSETVKPQAGLVHKWCTSGAQKRTKLLHLIGGR
jgi:hypothetical protein